MRKLMVLCIVILLCSCKQSGPQYNGYIDADLTYLSSNFAGRLTDLLIYRGEHVKKDQLLFKLEQTSESYGVAISQFNNQNLLAQRQEIINQLHYNEINYRRVVLMRKQNAASQTDLDTAIRDLDVAKNQLDAIDFQIKGGQVDTADKKWQVQRKENHASDPGIIFDTYFTKGEYVQAGQPVLSLITKRNIKVIFFVPEKDLSTTLLNSKINISSDGQPKLATGTISYVSKVAQYTFPLLYSRAERQYLVFRVEARIDTPDLNQLHLGQPVSLEFVR